MRPIRLVAALLATSLGGLTPIVLASCGSSSAPGVLGGGAGVDTGVAPYDGTMTTDDTGTGSAEAGELDSGPAAECGAGLTSCGIACVDLTTNPNNCGGCGNVCSGVNMVISCCASKCVDNTTDPNNCGACGIVCDGGPILDADIHGDAPVGPCVSGMCR